MYHIAKNEGHLLVKFIDDFDYPMIQTAIHHETMMREYADTNDIWFIGKYQAHIRLGEIEMLVQEFQCRCPRDAKRTKTAIVVNEGLTDSTIELFVKELKTRVAFEIEIYRTLDEAREWLGVSEACVT